jgi:hypothetical protein
MLAIVWPRIDRRSSADTRHCRYIDGDAHPAIRHYRTAVVALIATPAGSAVNAGGLHFQPHRDGTSTGKTRDSGSAHLKVGVSYNSRIE